ncbi:hypothetical protein AYI70_g2876 [Smittium culicis]|uniref:histone acetyltransferase n=1 Tax=Smittium culicis TaxID=133412 RepID=A0A1R1Y690_9FUNG|nr:hypothetical protein AYI70_g2876 [Smittium culicis]
MEQSFESILETLPNNSKLKLYNLTTPKTKTQCLLKNKDASNKTTFFEKSLILLALDTSNFSSDAAIDQFQNTPNANMPSETQSVSDETNDNFQFVAAIQAIRYTVYDQNPDLPPNNPNHQILYIEKIDSVPTHISSKDKLVGYTRLLVISYLKHYLAKNLPTSIYTFSKAQPEYLFPKSSINPSKNTLENHSLNKWWKKTLEIAFNYLQLTNPNKQPANTDTSSIQQTLRPQFYCYVPNTDKNSIHWLRESPPAAAAAASASADAAAAAHAGISSNAQAPATSASASDSASATAEISRHQTVIAAAWKFGFPFDDPALAGDSFYCFPDDPIARLLAKKSNRTMPISLFLDILSITEECGVGHQVAFFNVIVAGADADAGAGAGASGAAKPAADSSFATARCVAPHELDEFTIALFDNSIDFSSRAKACASTRKLADGLGKLICATEIIGLGSVSPAYPKLLAAVRAATKHVAIYSTGADVVAKRPAAANTTTANPVNVLNVNLVKRRKKN